MLASQTTKRHIIFLSLVLVFVFILSTEARAVLYPFEAVSWNSGVDPANAMAQQLSLEVSDLGMVGSYNQVEFIFKNNIAPYAVSPGQDGIATELLFEDGELLGIATINNYPYSGSLVDFIENPPPPNNTFGLGFDIASNYFRTDSVQNPPAATELDNGLADFEAVGIVYNLQDGKSFTDVITALELGFTTSNPSQYDGGNLIQGTGTTLRIGIHVRSIGDLGESDAYILTPIPSAVLLGILGLSVAGIKLRKFA